MVIGDLHCDTPYKLYKSGDTINNDNCHWSLKLVNEKDSFIQVFATCVEADEKLNSFEGAKSVILKFTEELKRFNFHVTDGLAHNSKVKALLSLEGGGALEGEIANVRRFYDLGVRVMTLTWNYENELGFGAVTKSENGLKPFGKEVIKEMNYLKIVPDVSHLNEAGFYDALELSEIPVIASHSNSKKICDNLRNLTDEQFIAIKNKGGIVGLNTYPLFLNNTFYATIFDCIKHLEHFLALGGEDVVCFGCDFDGIDITTKKFENISCYSNFVNELQKLNYSDELIAKISYINMKNYFSEHIFEFF